MFGLLRVKPKSTVIEPQMDFVVHHDSDTRLEQLEARREIEALRFATRQKMVEQEKVKLGQRKEQTKQIAIRTMNSMMAKGRLRSIDDRELLGLIAESLMHGRRSEGVARFQRWSER